MVSQAGKVDNTAKSLFLLLIIIKSGLLAEIRWSVCMIIVTVFRQDLTQGQKPEGRLKWGWRGGEGRERTETQTLLVCEAHWPTKCNVGLMRQAVSRIQIWIRARMPGYSINWTTKSSAIHRGQRLQLAHPKVAQPKLGAFQPRICHWLIPHPTRMPDGPAKKPGKYPCVCQSPIGVYVCHFLG